MSRVQETIIVWVYCSHSVSEIAIKLIIKLIEYLASAHSGRPKDYKTEIYQEKLYWTIAEEYMKQEEQLIADETGESLIPSIAKTRCGSEAVKFGRGKHFLDIIQLVNQPYKFVNIPFFGVEGAHPSDLICPFIPNMKRHQILQ